MIRKNRLCFALIFLLALSLLTGCGAPTAQPAPEPAAESVSEKAPAKAASIDELIAAIEPGAVIELAEGEFTLTPPANGGDVTKWCRWVDVYDGYELEIHDADGLTIRGAGRDKTVLSAAPRYANVITLRNCSDAVIADLTAGHTMKPGACSGGVIFLDSCRGVTVENCGLFGCGTVGVQTQNSADVTVKGTHVYECSYNAVSFYGSRNVRVDDCEVYRCGVKDEWSAGSLFEVVGTEDVVISHTRVYENKAQMLLAAWQSPQVRFLSDEVSGNRFESAVFSFERYAAAVDGCAFADNSRLSGWCGTIRPVNAAGDALSDSALEAMSLAEIDPASVRMPEPVKTAEVEPGGEIRVTTADELLAAIGPDRTILLAPGVYDLSSAADYGGIGGQYYFWEEVYDGPALVVSGVTGLTVRAESGAAADTVISAVPRYADVLTFRDCGDLRLEGFTAGHTLEPGECAGGVVFLQNCSSVDMVGCRLYGCGIMGIQCVGGTYLRVTGCEIYECSTGAVNIYNTSGAVFTDCDIHDVPNPSVYIDVSCDLEWNGAAIDNGIYSVAGDGSLRSYSWDEPDAAAGIPFETGSAELSFALKVQRVFADGDWSGLADLALFPLRVNTKEGSFMISDREAMLSGRLDGIFDAEFRRLVACAPLDGYRQTDRGFVFADGAAAFERLLTAEGDELRLTAVSTTFDLG